LTDEAWVQATLNHRMIQLTPLPQPTGLNVLDAGGRIGRNLRRLRRPFRQIRLETENETLNEDKYHGNT
ncbi:MAG: hypothetical protein ACPG7F_02800, partial [Aggregatilineales bacterium]